MKGDSLSWFLFWLGLGFEVCINIATGLLLSIVFVTLQIRRDLQAQLDEIWVLSHRAASAVYEAGGKENGDADANTTWIALEDEWLRARRTLQFALTDVKWAQMRAGIYAIRSLHLMNTNKMNERFDKFYPLTVTDAAGTHEKQNALDYGTWALKNGNLEEKAAYDAYQVQRDQIGRKIEYLLYFNSDLHEKTASNDEAPPLPTELVHAWHFTYLFPRACKWFFSELFHSFLKSFREQSKENEEQRRK